MSTVAVKCNADVYNTIQYTSRKLRLDNAASTTRSQWNLYTIELWSWHFLRKATSIGQQCVFCIHFRWLQLGYLFSDDASRHWHSRTHAHTRAYAAHTETPQCMRREGQAAGSVAQPQCAAAAGAGERGTQWRHVACCTGQVSGTEDMQPVALAMWAVLKTLSLLHLPEMTWRNDSVLLASRLTGVFQTVIWADIWLSR